MKTTRGFTLIELMIVLGMIGILIAIAVPRLTQYKYRARRAEVRTNITAIVHSQAAHRGEHATYTDNISRLDWSIMGRPHFIYGFTSDAVPGASGVNDTAELRANGGGSFTSDRMVDGFGNPLSQGDLPPATVSAVRFRVAAAANLDRDATLDQWFLDSDDNTIVLLKDDLEQ
jgi:prepilin-type N-terminal cleavage/methylation domain-containing protein